MAAIMNKDNAKLAFSGTSLYSWLSTVDHKRIGIMYILAALVFLVAGGLEAGLMRLQLATPENTTLAPDTFNQLFTMHGTTMIFFVGMPLVFGFANYLVPLMIGARDMAFPRLNALSFWLFLFGGILLYFSYFGGGGLYGMGDAPDVGWFAYAPLTSKTFSPGNSTDYWFIGLLVAGFGSLATACNLVTTVFIMRCKGMSLSKMPLFVWLILVASVMLIIGMAPLTGAQSMVLFDRHLGTHFFNPEGGGDVLLWQHLFWFFGHPEVYVLMLPGFAFASEIIPVFSRKVLFGYPSMVAATVAIGIIGLGAWAHHLFTIGFGPGVSTFFVVSTMLIAVPTGIKIFNWIATMYGGSLNMKMPLLCCLGFLFQFLVAGLTGVMMAVAPFDWQLHDSYFVVGHFHFVIVGGLLFTIFGAFYYWFPKVTGRLMCERLGRWHFWFFLVGFNLTFIPMHFSGVMGMARRIYTYPSEVGIGYLNMLSSLGVILQGVGIIAFVWNLWRSYHKGAIAGNDPWDAWTLEWKTSSPPPSYNFSEIPEVKSRRPLWDLKHPNDPDWKHE